MIFVCIFTLVNDGKNMLKNSSCTKPFREEAGYTNPVYEGNKNISCTKPLMEEAGITNPVYEGNTHYVGNSIHINCIWAVITEVG